MKPGERVPPRPINDDPPMKVAELAWSMGLVPGAAAFFAGDRSPGDCEKRGVPFVF
jgi:hypothetical protein